MFLLQSFQKWKLFDSETDDESEGDDQEPIDRVGPFVLKVCTQLVSAVQDLNGSHWDFMFDLAEYFIEVRPEVACITDLELTRTFFSLSIGRMDQRIVV